MPLFDRLLRAGETKLVKRLARIAQHIETLEPEVRELSDDALSHMELRGHDFYLFADAESGQPSVVYRKKGYDYGVIRLSH